MAAMVLLLSAAKGQGCVGTGSDGTVVTGGGGFGVGQVTPDVSGTWDLTYEDNLEITIRIGGAVYTETVGVAGGIVTIDHNGQPFSFELDCDRPAVVCPSEVWADQVMLEQPDALFPRNVYVTIPSFECEGELIDADPNECGEGTDNEECNPICDGDVSVHNEEVFGRISLDDERLRVLLGADIITNGFNCALLGVSVARARLQTTGSASEGDWTAVELTNGKVTTGFGAGCLWVDDPNGDGTAEAVVIGGSIEISTNFSGVKR